jgi:hypothetical protein
VILLTKCCFDVRFSELIDQLRSSKRAIDRRSVIFIRVRREEELTIGEPPVVCGGTGIDIGLEVCSVLCSHAISYRPVTLKIGLIGRVKRVIRGFRTIQRGSNVKDICGDSSFDKSNSLGDRRV